MSEVKDPKIKLFGKTIELPENAAAATADDEACDPGSSQSRGTAIGDSSNQDPACSSDSTLEDSRFLSGDAEEHESIKTPSVPETRHEHLISKELKNSNTTRPTSTDSNTPSNSDASIKTLKPKEDQTESTSNNSSNENTLRKPGKILPCPRCNSMDTKFCYFNNYNVSQPRHFCKNCQRYWTAGGTMRNVPVGAGRRRNKNSSASQFRHLMLPEALQLPDGIHRQHPNGTILNFGPDSPMCESISAVLNISENGPRKPDEVGISVPQGKKENGDDCSSRSDEAGSKSRLSEPMPFCHPFSYPSPHWPYTWNPVQWGPVGNFSVPFYSTAPPYWGWNVPWVMPPAAPNSPTLGKHARGDDDDIIVGPKGDSTEEETVKESIPEKCLWVPKTLRIDDPGEAAKSSIWTTLGIKNDGVDGGLFKTFRNEMEGGEKARPFGSSNPAVLSRSLSFLESS
ncbi:hypothetical protein OROGR_006862 [Orobanche gracilis]